MANSEYQPKTKPNNFSFITSAEIKPTQETNISVLFNKLIDETLSPDPNIKTFRATIQRETFEKHNVANSVLKGLFSAKKQRDLEITITPLMLVVYTFNIGGKFEDEKAFLRLYMDKKHSGSHLFIADGKDKNYPYRTKLKEKSINIGPEDYVNITTTVEEIAKKQGLIK